MRSRWIVPRPALPLMPREFIDPYMDPYTGVLRNKPGLRDEGALKQFEYQQTESRLRELALRPIEGRFDLDHLKAIHRYVFQDVYDWAGQVRTVNLSKGGTAFTQVAFIEGDGKKLGEALAAEGFLRGLDKPAFVGRLAHHYRDWNALHPFREGNGRATREFLGQLARAAGFEIDQRRIDNSKDQWNRAAWSSAKGDLAPITQAFTEAVRYSRAVAFETLTEPEALARHPELKGAFDGLRAVTYSLADRFAGNSKAQEHYGLQARSEVQRRLDAGQLVESPDRFKARERQPVYQAQGKVGYQAGHQPGYQAGARGAAGAGDGREERGR